MRATTAESVLSPASTFDPGVADGNTDGRRISVVLRTNNRNRVGRKVAVVLLLSRHL